MPITPFHFGPGVLLKAISPRRFDLKAFIATQIIIDIETAWNLIQGSERLHTTLHTYLGSLIAVPITLFFLSGYQKMESKTWAILFGQNKVGTKDPNLLKSAVIISSVIGVWSHVFFDSIMHADMMPFAPFSDTNIMLGMFSLTALHLGCLISGILGGIIWSVAILVKRNKNLRLESFHQVKQTKTGSLN